MTCKEKLRIEHPEYVKESFTGGCMSCPSSYGYLADPDYCEPGGSSSICRECWDREIPGTDGVSCLMFGNRGVAIGNPELMPCSVIIENCDSITLRHKTIDVDVKIDSANFKNIDTIIINGCKYVKEVKTND